LLPVEGDAVLATDGRYQQQAAAEAPDLRVVDSRAVGPDLVRLAAANNVRRLAIERHQVSLAAYDRLVAAASDAVEFVDAGQVVEQLRVVKDDEEIAALRQACEMTDAAFGAVIKTLRPGVTERDAAWTLHTEMRHHGADGPAFDSIVAFGPHAAIPHHQPTTRPLEPGDLVKLDFGARVDGYHADMTRTVVCGAPADWQRELHEAVVGIQSTCREATVVGAAPDELEQLARRLVEDTGHSFVHGLGHGVGLDIHEQPFLVRGTTAARLVDRVPVTVEPGIYLPGRGGVRVEDTVLVTAAGAEPLTTSPRDLIQT
jgi:Xaa-Pro aminopeptidase